MNELKQCGSRIALSDNEHGSGTCTSCESFYDASPVVSGIKTYGTHLLCTKDNQGFAIHPDFPCALHKFKER